MMTMLTTTLIIILAVLRRGGHMACVVALLHDASGRQASCDAGAFDSNGWTLNGGWRHGGSWLNGGW